MDAENRMEDPVQECGLIVQQEGKPQRVLAKFLNLMLNYQYGFSTLVAADLDDGQRLLALNEVFGGHQSHQSARYRIRFATLAEHHASSARAPPAGHAPSTWPARALCHYLCLANC